MGEENSREFAHSLNLKWNGKTVGAAKNRCKNIKIAGNDKAIQVLRELQTHLEDIGYRHSGKSQATDHKESEDYNGDGIPF